MTAWCSTCGRRKAAHAKIAVPTLPQLVRQDGGRHTLSSSAVPLRIVRVCALARADNGHLVHRARLDQVNEELARA